MSLPSANPEECENMEADLSLSSPRPLKEIEDKNLPAYNSAWNEVVSDIKFDEWKDITNDISDDDWRPLKDRLAAQRLCESWIARHLTSRITCGEWGEIKVIDFEYGNTLLNETAVRDLSKIEDRMFKRKQIEREGAIRAMISRRCKDKTLVVDSEEQLIDLLTILESVDQSKASVVIDCEGLSKRPEGDGTSIPERVRNLDMMELYVPRVGNIYLVGVSYLKDKTWTTSLKSGFSMKVFLTSPQYQKIMWDAKADAHVLDHLYGVRLDGIRDASLYEVAYRRARHTPPHHLDRLKVEHAISLHMRSAVDEIEREALEDAKNKRSSLKGSVWTERPLNPILIGYAADVRYMNMMYNRFSKFFEDQGRLAEIEEIDEMTRGEIQAVCHPFYNWDSDYGSGRTPFSSSYLNGIHMNNWDREQRARNQQNTETSWSRL